MGHIKTIAAPKTWPMKRKKHVYITRPYSSGQKMEFVLPINNIFKDILKYCKTTKEVQTILSDKEILVDGKRAKDPHIALGLMGVLTITPTGENYRLMLNRKGKLELKSIDKKEAALKPVVIKNKKVLAKDKIQLNMSDGRNIIIKKNEYNTGDSLIISLPEQEVKEHVKMDKGTIIMLLGGKHISMKGVIEGITGNKIMIKAEDGSVFETEKKYAIPIGTKKSGLTI